MGASTEFYEVNCNKKELDREANCLRDQSKYDHGHSGYTGTIAEDSGELEIKATPMSLEEAEEYIYENARKWGNSIAIPIKDKENVWIIGGWYSD